jgi:branched-chain amino acid transport system substrate-binding protein
LTVRIGFIGPLSGGPAAKGKGGRNSALLAVKQRNENPAARYRYELVVADDACDPTTGVGVAERMAADPSVIAGVTHYCSQVALACVELYHRHAFPVVVWGAHAAEITEGNDFAEIHRVSGTFANEDDAAARFMRERGCRTWAILHDPTDYGIGHAETLQKQIAVHGGQVRAIYGLSVDQQDLRSEIVQMRALGVDAVFVATAPSAWWTTHGGQVSLRRPPTDTPGWMPAPACFARQAAELGLHAQLHCPASVLRDARVLGDMGAAGEGTLAFEEGAPLDALPGGSEFASAYAQAGFAEPADAFGPFAYAAATLLMDVIEAAGPDRARVRDALNRVRGHPSLVGPVTFDATGQNVSLIISTYVAQGGAWKLWRDALKGQST